MEVKKIVGITPEDPAAMERAFAGLEAQPIACCNWEKDFPYQPKVSFKMFHTGDWLMLRFEVEEQYTAALVEVDNGRVCTDSCVELFIMPDSEGWYYNFETTCIGRMLLECHRSRHEGNSASLETISLVKRFPSYPFGKTFAEQVGDNRWSVMIAIPPQALYQHKLTDWSGVKGSMNLYKCGDNLSHPHFLTWKPVVAPQPDYHRPECFVPVYFEA